MIKHIVLTATLLLPALAVADARESDCRDSADFLRSSAQMRDRGVEQKIVQDAMRDVYDVSERKTRAALIKLAYTAKRGSPEQLHRDFYNACVYGIEP